VPHFEKMLYDNAQLATLYLEAAKVLGEPHYAEVALDTIDFLLRDMRVEGGGLGASWDADSGGKEGAYYLFSPSELEAIAGESDGAALARALGMTERGNFDGANIPTRRGDAALDRTTKGSVTLWERWRSKLDEARRRRPPPFFDPKVVTAWNGLALSALALGYRASGNKRLLDGAVEVATAVWRSNRLPAGELSRASSANRPNERGVLDDYAFLALGLVDLFEATSDPSYLERAVMLIEEASGRFARPLGGWFLTAGMDQEPLGRRMVLSDSVEPSGSAVMILVLERLSALTGRDEFFEAASKALRAQAAAMRQQGLEMAGWLDDALLAVGPRYELIVAGSDDVPSTRSLVDVWNGLLAPWTVGAHVEADGPGGELVHWMPPAADKRDRHGTALAYVCIRGACQAPTSDPARLRAALLTGWKR
jgi:uncharacterized protein YyaL (SSP411 family)